MNAGPSDPSFTRALEALVARLGLPALTGLRRLSGGASQETWAFLCGAERLILRRAPTGAKASADAIGLEREAQLMRAAAAVGVPCPRVRHVLTREDGAGTGFIMDFIEGETLGGRIVKSEALAPARPRLAYQCGEILARIHAVPGSACPPLPVRSARTVLDELQAKCAREAWPRPVFDLAFRWLRDRLPGDVPTTLVHGDFRNGNLIVGTDGVRAVLDWELACQGDPMQDLGWLCTASWRFGGDLPVGGFGRREDLFAGYEAGGGKVDAARVHFWEMLGSLRWGAICTSVSVALREGRTRAIDHPMIARRASETELDLVTLMQGAAHAG